MVENWSIGVHVHFGQAFLGFTTSRGFCVVLGRRLGQVAE